jgi:hypothetical protein
VEPEGAKQKTKPSTHWRETHIFISVLVLEKSLCFGRTITKKIPIHTGQEEE